MKYQVYRIDHKGIHIISQKLSMKEAYKLRDWMQLEAYRAGYKHSDLRFGIK